eukprot:scaffold33911_cov154-Skeletonema_menzelii.AAC.2
MTVTNPEPTAPPLGEEEIPVVAATAIPATTYVPTASATAYVADTTTAPAPRPGMSMVTKTTTYPDGRKVTTTEYTPNSTAAPAPPAANAQHHPPRRDLKSQPCSVTCPYCQHTGLTKTNQQCETAVKWSVGVGLSAAISDSQLILHSSSFACVSYF